MTRPSGVTGAAGGAGRHGGHQVTGLLGHRQGAEIRDPRSNLVIGHREEYLGRAEVERYCGEGGDCAVARMGKANGAAKAKDICRLAK